MSKVLAVLVLGSAASAQGAQWEALVTADGSVPVARHEAGMVEHGGRFYLIGGRGHRPVDRYDPATQSWTSLGEPPFEVHHLQPVVLDDLVHVVCAFTGEFPNETPLAHAWTYDPEGDSWAQGHAIPAHRRRGAAGVAAHGGALYVAGGSTHGHTASHVRWLDRYEPATGAWTELPDAPHARDHFTAVVVGNRFFAAGGRRTALPDLLLDTVAPVDAFDLAAGAWTTMPVPLPTPRAGTMAVARGDHLLVIGGESVLEAHDEVEALDTATGEWVLVPSLLQGRHGGGAALLGDTLHAVAGAGAPGGAPELDTHEALALGGLLSPSASNLLANGAFGGGFAGWSGGGSLALVAPGNVAAPALAVTTGGAWQDAAGVALETYTLRGVHGGTGGGLVGLEARDVAGGVLAQTWMGPGAAGSFTSFELRLTTPAGTASLRVRIEAGAGVLVVDDLVLVETPAEIPRFGSLANPFALPPTGNGPVLGALWAPGIDHAKFAPDASVDLLALGIAPLDVPTPFGTLLLDPATAVVLATTPSSAFVLPVPLDLALVGARLTAQGAALSPGGLALTNALDLTVQAP